ncbi:MAG: hypothetical protein LAT50_20800 [Ectothiorhodospiraceae bacterium]|nr:hypothetical protein [Ectothiorhodospiraceae bacterium]
MGKKKVTGNKQQQAKGGEFSLNSERPKAIFDCYTAHKATLMNDNANS